MPVRAKDSVSVFPLKLYPWLLLTWLLTGCITASRIDYPSDWPSSQRVTAGTCPHVAGTYESLGTLQGKGLGGGGWNNATNPNEWIGAMQLLPNLVGAVDAHAGLWTEVTQPDADTLVIRAQADSTNLEWVLSRTRGDFDCNALGLTMSTTGSLFSDKTRSTASNALMTALGILAFSGGVVGHTRSFRSLEDGSLLMELNRSGVAAHGFVIGYDSRSFVRWKLFVPERSGPLHEDNEGGTR
jgi:hypothetical protein